VLDASCLVRALVDGRPEATAWTDRARRRATLPAWPSILYPEFAHSLVKLERAGVVARAQAGEALDQVRWMRAHVRSARSSAAEAMAVALDRGLTVYDALYVVVAEALDAPLVTADRRLAAATEQAILLPG
jgi:predicted nucleic acid-binding protein